MASAADPSAPTTDEPCLDMQVVEALRELGGEEDPDLFDDLVETFAIDTPQRLDAIDDAVRCADAESLYRAAHGLKSGAANMGAKEVAESCRILEGQGKEGRLDGAVERVNLLRAQYSRALEALEDARERS